VFCTIVYCSLVVSLNSHPVLKEFSKLKSTTEIPRVIWFVWLQGLDKAPGLVHKCLRSWQENNPGWKINFIDDQNLSSYIDLSAIIDVDREDITIQKVVNIIRINLLDKFGGVWVDATCYCSIPLEKWLGEYSKAGFFVFRDPGADRILSSWFMASACPNPLTKHICQEINSFWQTNYFSNQNNRFGIRTLKLGLKFLNLNAVTTRYWLSFVFTKILRVYPYFIFHYHFANIVRKDQTCRSIWLSMPYLKADDSHRVLALGMYTTIDDELRSTIDTIDAPVQKLSWKIENPSNSVEDKVLGYFFSRN